MTKIRIALYSLGVLGSLIVVKQMSKKDPVLETASGVRSMKFNVLDQIKAMVVDKAPGPVTELALNSAIVDFLGVDDKEGSVGLDVADLDTDVSIDAGTFGNTMGTDIGFGILGTLGHMAIDLGNALTGSLFGNLAKGLHKGLTNMIDNAQAGLDADSAPSPGSDASPGGMPGSPGAGGNPDLGPSTAGVGSGGDGVGPGTGPSSPGVTGGGEGEGGYGGY